MNCARNLQIWALFSTLYKIIELKVVLFFDSFLFISTHKKLLQDVKLHLKNWCNLQLDWPRRLK